MFKKIISSIMTSIDTTVMAEGVDVEVTAKYDINNTVLAGSYTEPTDDGYIKKQFYVNGVHLHSMVEQ